MIAAVLFWFEVNMFNEKLVVNLFFFSTSSVPKENSFLWFFYSKCCFVDATMGLQIIANTSIDVCCCGGLN